MRTWVEVDLAKIRANVREIRTKLPEGTKILGVVKADAYGHGALPVARAMLEAGCAYLAVACLAEARELRRGGISAPILVLGVTPPEFAEELRELDVTQAVSGLRYAKALSDGLTAPIKAHLKLETGMGRTGFNAWRTAEREDILRAVSLPNLAWEGVFTHFAVSDEPEEDFTLEQYRRFTAAVAEIESRSGVHFAIRHCANSGAVINYPQMAETMVRPGIVVYGMYPAREHGSLVLEPALQLKSRIYAITEHLPGDTISYGRTYTVERPTRLAVVPVGYADGLMRSLSGRIDMLIRGCRCPQVGRICMDMCMVDITGVPDAVEGDIVTVIGSDGDERITADELAEKAGTINYEITCAVSSRVPRIAVN